MINFADEIKDRVSMRQICDKYGIEINATHKAVCPFHSDRRPSLHVYDGKDGWYCFTCGEGGDVIDFVKRYHGISFSAACEKINEDFGLGLPIGKQLTLAEYHAMRQSDRERQEKLKLKKEKHEKLICEYYTALDRYIQLDKLRQRFLPKKPDEISELYVYAVKHIAAAKDRLDTAEMRLYEYEHKR